MLRIKEWNVTKQAEDFKTKSGYWQETNRRIPDSQETIRGLSRNNRWIVKRHSGDCHELIRGLSRNNPGIARNNQGIVKRHSRDCQETIRVFIYNE